MIFPTGQGLNPNQPEESKISPRSIDYVPELKKNVRTSRQKQKMDRHAARQPKTPQSAQKMSPHDDIEMRHSTIGSARSGVLSDIGGPIKQLKVASSNTVMNPGRLEEMMKEKDNGELLRESLDKLAEMREQNKMASRNLGIDTEVLKDIIANGDASKGSSVSRMSGSESYNPKTYRSAGSLSIFDDNLDFESLPEKTAGEGLGAEGLKRALKAKADRSWANINKVASTKGRLDKFFK